MLDAFRLDGKVAVVTGAGRGLGRSATLALAQAGADVALLGRATSAIADVAREVDALGRRALLVTADVTDEKAVGEAAIEVAAKLGRVDVLVNNAGIAPVSPLLSLDAAELAQVFAVNVHGTMLCTRAFGAHMVAQRSGRVINVASIAGLGGESNLSAYSATKGAVIAFTRSLAVEWARHNVTVNAVAPGWFRTDMNSAAIDDPTVGKKLLASIPLRRFGDPAEIGPTFVYLASAAGAFVTGSVLVIDGGQSAH